MRSAEADSLTPMPIIRKTNVLTTKKTTKKIIIAITTIIIDVNTIKVIVQ